MMTLRNFEQYITPNQLEKGYDYFTENLVTSLRESPKDTWNAIVRGSNTYEVRVTLDNGAIVQASCNCPHKVEYCKHLIGVFYALSKVRAQ